MSEPSFVLVEFGSQQWEALAALRQEVLRTPLGLRLTPEELAAESGSYHFACHIDDELAGCVLLKPVEDGKIHMRQLAVTAERRGQGLGRFIVRKSEDFAREHGFSTMVLDARQHVAGFYEKLSYTREGEAYTHVGIPHVFMRKSLG